ncbi:uncharacterized protein LOC118199716 [Stegodyphus dumicola]|uniref:uncharacterized protein LOC118199716 n=1 Tax=Stegodyphus dumicola TaxID=202533 RepID=UPI0015B31A2F|nr:uncharacterized protein LOC118199716 [Stegodyphus dumicola]
MFTKSSWKVLSESCFSDPLLKVIVNAVNKYHEKTGEDSKIFILLLKEIMCNFESIVNVNDDNYLRKIISLEISDLMSYLPCIFSNMYISSAVSSAPHLDFKKFTCDLKGIVLTFLQSKFSPSVAKALCSLISEFILKCVGDWHLSKKVLEYLIINFDALCFKASLPLSASHILNGFILNQKLRFLDMGNANFIIVYDLIQQVSPNEATWEAECESLPLKLSTLYLNYEEMLNFVKIQNIAVIFTPCTVNAYLKSLFLKNNIVVLDSIVKEDIEIILFYTGISPLKFLNETLEPRNIGHLKSLRTVHSVKQPCMLLEFSSSLKWFNLNHIMLCAPFDAVWKEYYSECYNCLKIVHLWLFPEKVNYCCRKKRSVFVNNEFHLENKICSNLLKVDHNIVEYLCTACSVLNENSCKNDGRLNSEYLHDNESTSQYCPIGMSYPFGFWEISLKMTLAKLLRSEKLPFKNFLEIMNYALLNVISITLNISCTCNDDISESYCTFYERFKSKVLNPLEPVVIKEELIFHVLGLVQQLLKIDGLICQK